MVLMKKCINCGVLKSVEDFYNGTGMIDGKAGRCKECQKVNSQKNYKKNRSARILYERNREQCPKRKAKKAEYQRRSRAANPEKYKANQDVGNALRAGRLLKQPCEECGEKKAQAHHEDYSKPLIVEWLCRPCHVKRHNKNPY